LFPADKIASVEKQITALYIANNKYDAALDVYELNTEDDKYNEDAKKAFEAARDAWLAYVKDFMNGKHSLNLFGEKEKQTDKSGWEKTLENLVKRSITVGSAQTYKRGESGGQERFTKDLNERGKQKRLTFVDKLAARLRADTFPVTAGTRYRMRVFGPSGHAS